MIVLVVYDVSDDNKRLRLANILERWGLRRIQRSAFLGYIQECRVKDLERSIKMIIDESTDVVHLVPIDRRVLERVVVLGSSQWIAGSPRDGIVIR